MSEDIKLECWILGDDLDGVFPLRIAKGKTIGDLKKAIKAENEHAFQHVDARALSLWKFSIPEEELDAKLAQIAPRCHDLDKLRSTHLLSRVFSDPPVYGGSLRVVVVRLPPAASNKRILDFDNTSPRHNRRRVELSKVSETIYESDADPGRVRSARREASRRQEREENEAAEKRVQEVADMKLKSPELYEVGEIGMDELERRTDASSRANDEEKDDTTTTQRATRSTTMVQQSESEIETDGESEVVKMVATEVVGTRAMTETEVVGTQEGQQTKKKGKGCQVAVTTGKRKDRNEKNKQGLRDVSGKCDRCKGFKTPQKCVYGPDDRQCQNCKGGAKGCYWGGVSRTGSRKRRPEVVEVTEDEPTTSKGKCLICFRYTDKTIIPAVLQWIGRTPPHVQVASTSKIVARPVRKVTTKGKAKAAARESEDVESVEDGEIALVTVREEIVRCRAKERMYGLMVGKLQEQERDILARLEGSK